MVEHEKVDFTGRIGEFGYVGLDFGGLQRRKSEPRVSLRKSVSIQTNSPELRRNFGQNVANRPKCEGWGENGVSRDLGNAVARARRARGRRRPSRYLGSKEGIRSNSKSWICLSVSSRNNYSLHTLCFVEILRTPLVGTLINVPTDGLLKKKPFNSNFCYSFLQPRVQDSRHRMAPAPSARLHRGSQPWRRILRASFLCARKEKPQSSKSKSVPRRPNAGTRFNPNLRTAETAFLHTVRGKRYPIRKREVHKSMRE